MQALDTTIANVALPYMQGSLSATLDQVNWVLTSYIVAAAIMTPPTGWLAGAVRAQAAVHRPGRRLHRRLDAVRHRAVAARRWCCSGCCRACSARRWCRCRRRSCSTSSRSEKHGSAMALWGVGVMVGPILGPTLGGWLTESYSWRWVFYVNLPVGILTFLGLLDLPARDRAAQRAVRLVRLRHAQRRDRRAAADARPRRAARTGSARPRSWPRPSSSATAFYLFLVHTFTAERPFVNPRLFKDRNF